MCDRYPYKPRGDCRACGRYVEECQTIADAFDETVDISISLHRSKAGKVRARNLFLQTRPKARVNQAGEKLCAIPDCDKPRIAKSAYCRGHSQENWRRHYQKTREADHQGGKLNGYHNK